MNAEKHSIQDASLATADGLRKLTRRLFLRGAAVAVPVAALPTAAARGTRQIEENPDLLGLEDVVDRTDAEHRAAAAVYQEALRIGRELWPRAPEEITRPALGSEDSIERDIRGFAFKDAPGIWTADRVRSHLRSMDRWRKVTPEREEIRRRMLERLAAAAGYEADCAHALAVSGIGPAGDRLRASVEEMMRVLRLVQAEPARTMDGVRVKAKAMRAWGGVDLWIRITSPRTADWGEDLAQALLGVMEA